MSAIHADKVNHCFQMLFITNPESSPMLLSLIHLYCYSTSHCTVSVFSASQSKVTLVKEQASAQLQDHIKMQQDFGTMQAHMDTLNTVSFYLKLSHHLVKISIA